MNACSKQDLRAIRIKQPAEQAAFTREELMRRLEEHRRKKKELIETIQKEMHDRIKERTGEDVTSFNVW